jgi:hypothetical protein
MATKKRVRKAVKKGTPGKIKRGTSGARKSVLLRAKRELRALQKQEKAGNLTRRELQSGLEEIRKHMDAMFLHFFWI